MKRFVESVDRGQGTLFPDRLEDRVGDDNAARVVDVFVDELDLGGLGFGRVAPRATGRPGYQPAVPLKLYIHGYLNRVQSSRRLGATDLCIDTMEQSITRSSLGVPATEEAGYLAGFAVAIMSIFGF